MKTLLFICSLLACFCAKADSIVTATVTVTNTSGVAVASTITVNGVTRTAANPVTAAATQFLSGSTIGASATNIFNAFSQTRPPASDVFMLSTNAVILKSYVGSPMVVTISAGWGTVTFSTNTTTGWTEVRVPISVAGNIERTNVESGLVDYFNDNKATNTINASVSAFANFANLTLAQTVTGAKIFSGANVYSNAAQTIIGGYTTNQNIINAATISGTLGNLTNGTFTNPVFTNGQNYGDPFRSPGTGLGSEQFGISAQATANYALAYGDASVASGIGAVAVGHSATASGQSSVAFGFDSVAGAAFSTAIGTSSTANGSGSSAFGWAASAAHTNSTAVGQSATTTGPDQVMLGSVTEYVEFPGNAHITGNVTNVHQVGVNTVDGQVSYLRKNITTLVNGAPNLISTSTNLFLKLSGPTGAFTINAMDGGTDGRMLILYNITGQTMTIANNSGALGVAANRILTGTGADVVGAYAATFIYDSAQSLWILISKN